MKKLKNNPDPGPLRVLILEDNPVDAELVERELRRAKIAFTSRIVEGKRAFAKALADFLPQVILSDFKLPAFDGLAALEVARQKAPDIPFIFVSGSIGEEKAIEMLSRGASDYIFKDNLARLGPSVNRVVETARLKLEKKNNEEELQLLAQAADRFVHFNDLDKVYDYLAKTICAISGADYLLLSLYDEKLQAVRPKIITGFEPFRETMRRRFHIDPMQMVFYLKDMRPDDFSDFVSRRLLPASDGLYGLFNRKLPRSLCRSIEKLLAIDSMHTMGFSWENKLFGGVTVFFKKGNRLKNASQIEALANLAAVAIKRLMAERSLRSGEERFRHISATISDISYSCLLDKEGMYSLSWMTGAAERITGYTIEELIAMKCWGKLVLTEEIPEFEKHVTGLTTGNSGICELRLRHKNGNVIWVQSFAECTTNPEPPQQPILYGALVDISSRKQVETALRESETKYRTLVTQSPDGIFVVDLQGNFLSVNQAMCDGLSYSEAEFLSLKIGDIVPAQYMELHKQRLAVILKGETKNEAAEYMVKGKDGEPHYISILSAPFYKGNQLIGFQGIARDITEKNKMEIRLRESEEYYRTLVETSPDAIIIIDAGGRVTFASPKTSEVFGIPSQNNLAGLSIADFVEPGEISRVQARMVEILSGHSLPQINEYRLLKHDRRPFWGEISSSPLRDAAGRNIGLLLVCRDVSDRRRSEARLRESEEKYRLIADNTAETITVLDQDLRFTYVSPSIFKLRGYTVEEALSLTLQQTLTADSYAKIQEVFSEEMALEASGGANPQRSRSLELQEYRKDGSIVWVENSLSHLRDAQGRAIGFLAVSKDINERKRAETIQHIQYKIANAVVTAETFLTLFETVRKELGALLDTTNFLIALYDEASGMLSAPFEKDEKDAVPQWRAEKSLTGLVIRQKQPLLLSKEQIRQMAQSGTVVLIGSRAETWLGVPLLINEKALGAIVVQSYDKADAYDQSSIHVLEMVASQLSIYIERKRSEKNLQDTLDRHIATLKAIPDLLFEVDRSGRIFAYNAPSDRSLYVAPNTFLGKTIDEVLPPEVVQIIHEALDEAFQNGFHRGAVYRLDLPSGAAWFELSIAVKGEGGQPDSRFMVTARDISERYQAAEQLKERDRLLQNLSAQIPGMIFTFLRRTDGSYCIPYSSNAIQGIFGVSPPDVIKDAAAIFKPILADDRQKVKAAIEISARMLTPWRAEFRVQLPGQPVRWMTGQSDPYKLADGSILWYGFANDITEHKHAEEHIRSSLKEKEVLLQEIHHRVKNNLQIISGLLTLQAEQSAGKSLAEIFRESQDRIRSIALIHEKLYRSHNLAEIAFDDYLRALAENLFISHGVSAGTIAIKYEMEPIFFTIEKAIPLGLIVNELVTNALKHAFPDGRRGEIRIGLHGQKDSMFIGVKTDSGKLYRPPICELIVADDGVGLPAGQVPEQQKTLGMNLVSMLANQLQAELKVKTGPGTEFHLLFPGIPTDKNGKGKDHGG